MLIDFWAGDTGPPYWYDGFEDDWPRVISALLSRAGHVTFLGDAPTLPIAKTPSNDLLKNYVYQRRMSDGNFNFMNTLQEDPSYKARRQYHEGKIKTAIAGFDIQAVQFLEVQPYFTKQVR